MEVPGVRGVLWGGNAPPSMIPTNGSNALGSNTDLSASSGQSSARWLRTIDTLSIGFVNRIRRVSVHGCVSQSSAHKTHVHVSYTILPLYITHYVHICVYKRARNVITTFCYCTAVLVIFYYYYYYRFLSTHTHIHHTYNDEMRMAALVIFCPRARPT